ncbi:MAG: CocE/NonD family hydrolase, partial [Anaerolineae bacterium]|nr:CocE/NonD family hydrolase [Anaerolineae bacterium]
MMRSKRMIILGMVIVLLLAGLAPAAAQDGGAGGLQTVMVPMPDGVQLATDVYLPAGEGPWPVLLLRSPYGRRDMGGMADGLMGAGIAVVAQDVRGRFDSGGDFLPFRNDKVDGQATLDWILAQAWGGDRIATWGASALGIASYMLAPGAPPELVCQWTEVATPDLYTYAMFQDGVYREALFELWLEGLGEGDVIPALREHPLNDDYWDVTQIVDDYAQVNVMGIHIGGWYDIFARGTVAAFQGYQTQGGPDAAGQQHLFMGPWAHDINNPTVGELTFPNGAWDQYEQTLFMWLDACLLDGGFGLSTLADFDTQPAVRYFTMGAVGEAGAPGNEWHSADAWPPKHVEIPVYLHPNNYLSVDMPPDNDGDAFVYDPADPTPTICGQNLSIPAGSCDQREVEVRDDVVVYSTLPLPEPVEVTGDLRVEVWITTDVVDTDIA